MKPQADIVSYINAVNQHLHQPGFPDTSLACQQHDIALTLASPFPSSLKNFNFFFTINHWQKLSAMGCLESTLAGNFTQDTPCLYLMIEAFQLVVSKIFMVKRRLNRAAKVADTAPTAELSTKLVNPMTNSPVMRKNMSSGRIPA